ncbi:hypothetical protein LZ30DRAFT_410296 [Colletotrichum cereale]|nr:hypothetical protein LZ30DRAFT_410296 [Colletotrichum cereale]
MAAFVVRHHHRGVDTGQPLRPLSSPNPTPARPFYSVRPGRELKYLCRTFPCPSHFGRTVMSTRPGLPDAITAAGAERPPRPPRIAFMPPRPPASPIPFLGVSSADALEALLSVRTPRLLVWVGSARLVRQGDAAWREKGLCGMGARYASEEGA